MTMNIKALFLSALKASEMDNYGKGIEQHHGVHVYSDELQISMDLVPGHIVNGKHTSESTLLVFKSERGIVPITGGYKKTFGFTQNEINYIIDMLQRKFGADGILDKWNINENSASLSFIVRHQCSPSFIAAFEYYKSMKDVFNFTKREQSMLANFKTQWIQNTELFLDFAKEL